MTEPERNPWIVSHETHTAKTIPSRIASDRRMISGHLAMLAGEGNAVI
jgi:hypothetical protein